MTFRVFGFPKATTYTTKMHKIQDILVSGFDGWLGASVAGHSPGVDNGLLDEVRSSAMASYELQMVAGCLKELRNC